ncbi:MAG: lipopolysaccharide core heptose(II) kinase RfaY [Cyclobacteriaceae bacterium]
METIDNIPTSKIKRASKIFSTGAKVGINYAKYYGNRLTKSKEEAKEMLDLQNADDIYDGLKNLKGSALKVAQMLSMDKNIMPRAYVEKFSLSQFSVPPLSPALVVKTFRKYFGQGPDEIFDSFTPNSVHAASIGQVHMAEKDGKKLAVKIQYPGVADSISSDLALVKPIAMKMFNIKGEGSDQYFEEVQNKLLEETNYLLEVKQSKVIAEGCKDLKNIAFPKYYENLSSDRIITMDWLEGLHLSEFVKVNQNPDLADQVGQALWDFYMFQIHQLRMVQADPHPGNFLVDKNGILLALDFGCIKNIPDDFYDPYFEMATPGKLNDKVRFMELLYELEILKKTDTSQEIAFFSEMFHKMLSLFVKPLQEEKFSFTDHSFFDEISALGEDYAKRTELRKLNGNRGSRHFIYMNRTFFGLYNLMFDLAARDVEIRRFAETKKEEII